jgi:glucokinase
MRAGEYKYLTPSCYSLIQDSDNYEDMKVTLEASNAMTKELSTAPTSSQDNSHESDAPYVIGVDIGASSLRLALANGAGAILERWSTSTAGEHSVKAVVRLIREGVDVLLRKVPSHALSAIAAGAPGVTDADEGVVIATSYLMGWRDVPLRDLLESEFGVPASVDNDVNLGAIGEHSAGVARGANDFVFLAIGTGLGAGIVMNGRVHRGSIWRAGEIGYMLVPGIPVVLVERGKPGTLEGVVGGEGIKAQWQIRWDKSLTTLPKDATATQIFDYALESNPLAQEVLQLAARTLAYAIYNTSLILNPPLFVLGGSVGIHPALGDATRTVLDQLRTRVQSRVMCSSLGADAQLIGAVFVALETANKRLAPTGYDSSQVHPLPKGIPRKRSLAQ